MSSSLVGYGWETLATGFRDAGLRAGDLVFVHVNLDQLGPLDDGPERPRAPELLLRALRDVVGEQGTILVPTYTFSFCRQESFDREQTPTAGGPWSPSADFLEYFRRLPGVIRSADPIHSVAGQGPRAAELLEQVPPTCFGPGSVFSRLLELEGKICMIGLPLEEATFRHHTEELAGVPFRYKKLFTGVVSDQGSTHKQGWTYNVRLLADNAFPDGLRLEKQARAAGICRAVRVGQGEVLVVEAAPYHRLTLELLQQDPWATARGPAGDPVALENDRVGNGRPKVQLGPDATMEQMIHALWRLPRHLVSDGYDAALEALAAQLPMTIHQYPSGLECWSWIIPEKWSCHEAYLETLDGRRLFSSADNPLHVVAYSLPFDGVISRGTLLQHLHVHPRLADAVPFVFKYYERDWGLCCSDRMRRELREPYYRVVIRSSFSRGTLKVGEAIVPGRTEDCIVLCAHLCHPAMVNDDLSGVVVGVEVMRRLRQRRDLRYTYRFIVVPETIGSVAYLSQNESLIPKMKGGLFLEMLGLSNPHALQRSFASDSEVDRCFTLALRSQDPDSWTGAFREIIGNDERQFNAPGVRVPMLSLSRVRRPSDPEWPYLEYHSSQDTPEVCSEAQLEASCKAVLHMIDAWERNVVPRNQFKGEVFCSRYGLHLDPYTDPEAHRALFDIMFLIDGTRSLVDIAETCGVSLAAVERVVGELSRQGLVAVS